MEQVVPCPHCGAENQIDGPAVLDVRVHPELKAAAERLAPFAFPCGRCGGRITAPYACVYRDDDKRFAVRLTPPGFSPVSVSPPKGYALRDTATMFAFREKIVLFSNGLDDRAVELLKLVTERANRRDGLTELLLVDVREDSIGFHAFLKNGGELSFRTPIELYDALLAELPAAWTAEGFLCVDEDWVRKKLREAPPARPERR